MTKNSPIHFYYSGIIILIALVLGGGTTQGLWTDHLLQILLFPALFMGLMNIHNSRFTNLAISFLFILFAYFILQLFPFSREITINNTNIIIDSALFSFSPQKSLEAILYATSILGFSLYLSRFNDDELSRLIRFFMIGLAVNLILGAFQLSFSGRTEINGFLPYTITSATFANENHFSTLAFASLPLIAFHYLVRIKAPIIFFSISAIISFILFAVGSRAGMAMTLAVAASCLFWFSFNKISPILKLNLIIALLIFASIVVYLFIDFSDLEGLSRYNFIQNTFAAFKDNYLLGTGLGSFIDIYPSYEPLFETRQFYVNHTHNEYVELLLETGLVGAILFLFFTSLLIFGFSRSKLSQASGFGIFAIAAHSLIDYPLRTMAIAILFAYFITVLLSENEMSKDNSPKS
ncbi:MAG: O-antigen ligase family protein [Rhizobiales bacterium]|nr:O-antigen ligase family protein [Hyphomicrobiales bacterium]